MNSTLMRIYFKVTLSSCTLVSVVATHYKYSKSPFQFFKMASKSILTAIFITVFIQWVVCLPPIILEKEEPDLEDTSNRILTPYRLPKSVIPSHYTIEIQTILDPGYGTQFTAPGKVWIDVRCEETTSNITLHATTLNISESSVKVTDTSGSEVGIASFEIDEEKEFFIIKLQSSLRVGTEYKIYIEYVAPISNQLLLGLYLSNYTASDGTISYMAVTDFEATDSRRAFPNFDEPALKATFDISIIHLAKYHSLSNMDLLRTETNLPGLPGWVKDVFNRTEIMSTYLVCIAVSDFELEEASLEHYRKPVKVWGPPSYMQAGAGKYSPNITAKLLTALETYFHVPYTFSKMDKIAVPHFASGAMENWGLNTYRLNRLLLEDGIATAADRISTASTLSHELVHQWFGNLVTMEWWDDLWLNEGFASYYSNTAMLDIGLEDMLPMDILVSDSVQRAMAYDVTNATHPIHHPASTPVEIRVLFDTITYSKGASIVRMTNAILTENVMRNGLVSYLMKYDHKNAHQDDLFQVLHDEAASLPGNLIPSDLTLKEIMDTWTLQSGFPVLRVTRMEGTTSASFSQERFKYDVDNEVEPTSWHIPIAIQLSTDIRVDTKPKIWLKKDEPVQFTQVTSPWFIVNPQQTGYYRVQYDSYSLRQIIEQLHKDHTLIDAQTRSGLIDDNLNLAYAGYTSINDALNLTMYLKNERHLTPWTSFLNNMAKPYRFLARTSSLSAFKRYILGLVKDTLTEIKIDPQPNEPIGNATILRNRLFQWACNLGDSDCITYSTEKYANFMTSSNLSTIFPDLRPMVYCTAINNGGDKEWDFALAQYKVADREVTKTNLIQALGCSKSTYRLSKLLTLAIDLNSGIETSHRTVAIQAVAGNSAGTELAFRFIRENFETIRRRFGTTMISSVVTTLSNSLHKDFDITDLEKFIKENEEALQPVNSPLQTALGNIHANVKWMNRNEQAFRDFVENI